MKKKSLPPRLTLLLIIGIAVLGAVIVSPLTTDLSGAAGSAQAAIGTTLTPTPKVIDALEVGSTDGILVLSILIALAILIPIFISGTLWKKKTPK